MDPETAAAETSAEPTLATGPVESAPVAETAPVAEIKQNPAWAPILEVVPTSLHALIEPKLKEWDQGVSKKFEEAAAQRKSYEPYNEFIENNADPEMIRAGLSLLEQIQNDPRSVYDQMGTHFEFNKQTGEVEEVLDDPYAEPENARITQLEKTLEQLVGQIQNERSTVEQEAQDRALEGHLGDLEKTYGAYDREFVLTQMAAGASGEDAVKAYMTLVDKIKTDANKPAPVVIGGGKGGVAVSEQPDTGKMKPGDRRNLVAQMLGKAQQDSNS